MRAVHEAMTSPGLIRTVRPTSRWIAPSSGSRDVGRRSSWTTAGWSAGSPRAISTAGTAGILGEAVPDGGPDPAPTRPRGVGDLGGGHPQRAPLHARPRSAGRPEHRSGPLLVNTAGTGKSWVLAGALRPAGGVRRPRAHRARGRSRRARQAARDALIARVPLLALEPQRPDLPRPGPPDPPRAVRRPRVRGAARGAVGGRSVRAGAGPARRT